MMLLHYWCLAKVAKNSASMWGRKHTHTQTPIFAFQAENPGRAAMHTPRTAQTVAGPRWGNAI